MRDAVVDASALLNFLLDPAARPTVGALFADPGVRLSIPHLCDAEVVSGLRRLMLSGTLAPKRARETIEDLEGLPLMRFPHLPLASRALELWQNLAAADGLYVALAEALHATLVTSDARLARAAREHTALKVAEV